VGDSPKTQGEGTGFRSVRKQRGPLARKRMESGRKTKGLTSLHNYAGVRKSNKKTLARGEQVSRGVAVGRPAFGGNCKHSLRQASKEGLKGGTKNK